jgi:hypothetical protein
MFSVTLALVQVTGQSTAQNIPEPPETGIAPYSVQSEQHVKGSDHTADHSGSTNSAAATSGAEHSTATATNNPSSLTLRSSTSYASQGPPATAAHLADDLNEHVDQALSNMPRAPPISGSLPPAGPDAQDTRATHLMHAAHHCASAVPSPTDPPEATTRGQLGEGIPMPSAPPASALRPAKSSASISETSPSQQPETSAAASSGNTGDQVGRRDLGSSPSSADAPLQVRLSINENVCGTCHTVACLQPVLFVNQNIGMYSWHEILSALESGMNGLYSVISASGLYSATHALVQLHDQGVGGSY